MSEKTRMYSRTEWVLTLSGRMLQALAEILTGVVNHVISTDRPDQIGIACAAYADDICAEYDICAE